MRTSGGKRIRGFTFIEVLVGILLASLVLGVAYGIFYILFGSSSRHNLTRLTRRSFLQKDVKVGLRRLVYRLREGIQIIAPLPGFSSDFVEFRDVTNQRIRIRRDPAIRQIITERAEGGAWVLETRPTEVVLTSGQSLPASLPVKMVNCESLHFTVLSPECVSVRVGLTHDSEQGAFMTIVKFRNSNLAY